MALAEHRTPGIRPNLTLGRRLDIAWRHAFPCVSTILLMLLSLAPAHLPNQAALLPAVALTCVWFWSLYRPEAMSPPIVFLIGIFFDLLGFLPLGVGAVTMLFTHGFTQWSRRFLARQGITLVWLVFTGIAFCISFLNWGLVSLLTLSLIPVRPVLFQGGVAAALYPVVAVPLMLAHRTFADPDKA
jgi:rod shape-determining protein MreD